MRLRIERYRGLTKAYAHDRNPQTTLRRARRFAGCDDLSLVRDARYVLTVRAGGCLIQVLQITSFCAS
jgi:hypothetical protein